MLFAIYKIAACHLIGDYSLQTGYMAENKGKDWYILFVHCLVYTVPFAVVMGGDWRLIPLFLTHLVVDIGKARKHMLNLWQDQLLHYIMAAVLYLLF